VSSGERYRRSAAAQELQRDLDQPHARGPRTSNPRRGSESRQAASELGCAGKHVARGSHGRRSNRYRPDNTLVICGKMQAIVVIAGAGGSNPAALAPLWEPGGRAFTRAPRRSPAQSRLERSLHPADPGRGVLAREVDAALRLRDRPAKRTHLRRPEPHVGAPGPLVLVPALGRPALEVPAKIGVDALHLREAHAVAGLHSSNSPGLDTRRVTGQGWPADRAG
jgi:hypothetical protein